MKRKSNLNSLILNRDLRKRLVSLLFLLYRWEISGKGIHSHMLKVLEQVTKIQTLKLQLSILNFQIIMEYWLEQLLLSVLQFLEYLVVYFQIDLTGETSFACHVFYGVCAHFSVGISTLFLWCLFWDSFLDFLKLFLDLLHIQLYLIFTILSIGQQPIQFII